MNIDPARLPSTRALMAFEAAARHGSFSRAAEMLHTSQSAISRHVAALESRLGVKLFVRERQRVHLSEQGTYFLHAVTTGLGGIRSAMDVLRRWSGEDRVTIGCSQVVSQGVLLHRFADLQDAAGTEAEVRVVTAEYDALTAVDDPSVDIVIAYGRRGRGARGAVTLLPERVVPVCAPGFASTHRRALADGPGAWPSLGLMRLTQPNRGWMTWEQWYAARGLPFADEPAVEMESYVYLLEAAAAGRGIALGWLGFIEDHLTNGRLVMLDDVPVASDRVLLAWPTTRPSKAAQRCLERMATWFAPPRSSPPTASPAPRTASP